MAGGGRRGLHTAIGHFCDGQALETGGSRTGFGGKEINYPAGGIGILSSALILER